ncbi:unnamed protein product [Mycena citricolor]|uniref:VWFA domain-containing protein n=1 Tax=Mycena citricolor TaxID=2018698 RepID=A0AAD2K0W6_9AGAR|nr:unnamed protein product [Mycena citricolor]
MHTSTSNSAQSSLSQPSERPHISVGDHDAPPTYFAPSPSLLSPSSSNAILPLSNGSYVSVILASPLQLAPVEKEGYVPPPTLEEDENDISELDCSILRKYDVVVIMDDSSSMRHVEKNHEKSRWCEAVDALGALAGTAAKYDADGIEIRFLNHPKRLTRLKSREDVLRAISSIRPQGGTDIGEHLRKVLNSYTTKLNMSRYTPGWKIKRLNVIVITDGQSSDDPAIPIINAAEEIARLKNKVPLNQIGIQFIQIGSDPGATRSLQKLDDDLHQETGLPDIVDTVTYDQLKTYNKLSRDTITGYGLVKVLTGAINRRVDNMEVHGSKQVPMKS